MPHNWPTGRRSPETRLTHDDMNAAPASLRDRLRQDTAEAHKSLDAMLDTYDLRRADGLGRFLQVNERGFAALAGTQAASARVAADLSRRMRTDLAVLGRLPLPRAAPLRDSLSALAIDYVVYGSRLGARIQQRQWASATDPLVRRATQTFGTEPEIDAWKRFCDQAGGMPATGATADRAIDDSRLIFGLFIEGAYF